MADTIAGFDWDFGNREKCRKHDVSLAEIEAVLRRPLAIHPARLSRAEERFIAIGSTREKRNVLVVFTLRRRNGQTLMRPISARYMHRREVAHYEKAAETED
jgi:uncharacterized protein